MMPTADQVARAIIASAKECKFYEKLKARPSIIDMRWPKDSTLSIKLKRVRAYAALALRAAFPSCPSPTIGRCVGAGRPCGYLGLLIAWKAKGHLSWHDPEVEARVIEAIGPVEGHHEQTIVDETEEEPVTFSAPVNSGRFVSLEGGMRPLSKSKLEDELRRAVLNTGGRLA
jgi:hypothetical protein